MTHAIGAPQDRVAAILAHPRFAEARRAQIDGYLRLYSGDPALNKLLMEGARHVIFTFVICLAAGQREDDPDTWLTLGKLQDVVVAHQVGSPGLVEALIARMIDRGLLTSTPAPGDRRKRILAPTAALLDHDLDLIRVQAAPCAIVAPSPAIERALAGDADFQQANRQVSIEAFGAAMALVGRHLEMLLFIGKDSGLLILFALLASALDSPTGVSAQVPSQALADRFGVSRTHVRDLIREAEGAGFLRVVPGNGIEIEAKLWPVLDRWIADCMDLFIDCCETTLERLGQSTG